MTDPADDAATLAAMALAVCSIDDAVPCTKPCRNCLRKSRAALTAARGEMVPQWRTDMENAPTETLHLRGLWVYSSTTKKPLYFDAVCGTETEGGGFDYSCGDDCGWRAADFTHWAPVPAAPTQGGEDAR